MRRVFDCWPQIISRIRAADSIALFLDFDGTLAPIRATPNEVRLSQPTRAVIARLAASSRVRVWVISGRKQADVRGRTGVPGVQYMGLHGWEGRVDAALGPETKRVLENAKSWLAHRIEPMRGIWIEDKGSTFAVHYRGAAETESSLAQAEMVEVMARLNGSFRLLSGKKVWEVLPRELGDKGSAVRRELSRFDRRALPVYIGDDATDERAFSALPGGLTIRVGPQALTRAQFQLRDPASVRLFLERFEQELS
jgi:trehalose-phosphatase